MKKRTLVCFLIFTLCVLYTSIPTTVFGQEVSLAEQVAAKYSETLQREDIQAVLPAVLEGLKAPDIQALLNPQTITLIVDNPGLLPQFAPDIDPKFVTLLKEDVELQALLRDPIVQELLQDPVEIDKLAGLLDVSAPEPDPGPPPEPDPGPPGPPPEPDPGPPGPPPVKEIIPADPFAQIMPTNESILGKSRLGGLALNKISGRQFVAEVFEKATGLPIETLGTFGLTQDRFVKMVVELITSDLSKQVPFPSTQILQVLRSKDLKFFAEELDGKDLAQGLDRENFGNAVTPMLLELLWYDSQGDLEYPNRKYLTQNSLNLYAHVPSVNVSGVRFELSDGTVKEGERVNNPTVLGSDTIPYTFRLEEALAATNLPAWPALENDLERLFDAVTLRYSSTGLDGDYIGVDMQPIFGPEGVVWEAKIDVTPGGNYYYFNVELANPVMLEILDRVELAKLARSVSEGNRVEIADVLYATKHLPIKMWSMPDPRNLQLADRGIIDALFDNRFRNAVGSALNPLITEFLDSGQLPTNQQLQNALGKNQAKLQNILLQNASTFTEQFEEAFDPMLASVFSVPRIDPQSESLWVAELSDIPEGDHWLGAFVYDAAGDPLDLMQGEFIVDTSAPEADIAVLPETNTGSYRNDDNVYVATAIHPSAAATLNITGVPTQGRIASGEGYLLYQIVELEEDGTPYQGAASFERPNTWMPLTIEATMLASRVWDETIAQLLGQGLIPEDIDLGSGAKIPTRTLSLETVLTVLGTPVGIGIMQDALNPSLKILGGLLNMNLQLGDQTTQLLVDIFGQTVELVNAVPITFGDPHNIVVMPIQGENMPLLRGEYGIRALGIDTLFNVSSHTLPTRLSIVPPTYDKASVTAASIGDRNGDGDADEPYENGTIFSNTTDGVMLTVTVDKRTVHPAKIWAEYMDANGAWQPIGEARMFAEGEDVSMFEVSWDVTDFDALVSAGNSVMVRAVATNELQLTHMSEPFSINLDAGVHPVDIEVLALVLDTASITKTNPDSGGPQGTVVINGYTPQRTYPEIASLKVPIGDKVFSSSGESVLVTAEEVAALQQNTDFITDLVAVAAEATAADELSGKPIYYPTYLKWSVEVDTTTLEDTITAESASARDASKDDSQHLATAIAVTSGAEEVPGRPGAKTYLSVDNVDDVGPLGPTNIVAVADVAGAIDADADGNYTVGGIVDETVQSPIATYTTEPAADPSTYASVKLVQVDADGTETVIDGEVGVLDITTDVGMLANGAYMLHALAVDEFGNMQTDESPQTTVNVLNFRVADVSSLKVTAVDGVDVPRTPTEPIPLRSSLTVGFDVDNGSLDAEDLSGSVPGNDVSSEREENPENTFSLKIDVSGLSDGVYTPDAVVTKRNGSVSFPLATINLDNTGPMVEIQTPSEDDTVDSMPTVHATYHDGEGSGVDGTSGSVVLARLHPPDEVSVDVDQNSLEKDETTLVYTRTEKLPGGAYRVTVQVADILGNVGEGSAEFAINGTPVDTTPPVITEVAPSGTIKGESWVTLSAVVNDAESKVISVKFGIDDKPLRSVAPAQIAEGRVQVADGFTAGTHTVKLIAISEGGKREHSWTFTLVVDNVAPTITSVTPTGTIRAGLPVISASANDESGVDEMDIVLMDSNGKEVKGDTEDDGEDDVEGITRLDFIPEKPLDEGTYTIDVRATDTIGNSATARGSFTIDFDTAAPVITMASPQNEARLTERRPQISITYADAESGVDVDAIRFVLDDKLINLKPNQKSASQVMYTPDIDLAFGQHTVKLEVSDMAHKEGNVSEKSSGAREANMAVHEFTFFVESEEGPVLASRPINAPNPFKENTRISFTLTRQSTVSIIIYDTTLRPVRVLVDNEVWDAGEYVGKGAIGWDGTTTAGEDLARGVYFCQIMVADGFEPEYAILKLALTR